MANDGTMYTRKVTKEGWLEIGKRAYYVGKLYGGR
jgi:hypothetical protein